MKEVGFGNLLAAVGDLVHTTPELQGFSPWPDAPPTATFAPQDIPAIPLIEGLAAASTPRTAPVVDAIKAVARTANWRQSYAEAEVGRDFLSRYGWFELLGPTGHFLSGTVRAYIAYWGEGLHYPMHQHEAEELYYILAGAAEFHADGRPSALLAPEGTRHHTSNEPHAMDTHAEPVLTLVLWRGKGISGSARIGTT